MPQDKMADEKSVCTERVQRYTYKESFKWSPWRLIHWLIVITGVLYALWSFSVSKESEFLVKEMRRRTFASSPYGFQRKQDTTHYAWRPKRHYVLLSWKWLLLHPVMGRAVAYASPSLVPVFHSIYSLLMLASLLSWEVAALCLCEHALFYALTVLRSPALSYTAALLTQGHSLILRRNYLSYFFLPRGPPFFMITTSIVHWNILRCLSFSIDYIRAERLKTEHTRHRLPPYWKTLAYVVYVPTTYLGPLQTYDDYVREVGKPRSPCRLRDVASIIARFLRSGVHFVLMETMTHFIYSSAMAEWPWMIEKLDATCIVGFVLASHFFFYIRYVFAYGVAGAVASAEGIDIPPHAKCIARLNKCSHFWRYFDRGMHLYIRRYVYEPVEGNRKKPGWTVVGTASAFAFTWYWHGLHKEDGIWCLLSVLGISIEVFVTEVRKLRFIKCFEERYLGTPGRMREASAILGSPHYLLTILACLFHLAEVEVCFIVIKAALFGFPFPVLPVLVVLYCACHVSYDAFQWEAAREKRKQA
uniref:Acyltransferase required for palmitoylation of hedgehog hh family of secreted signaling n=1 Tax=Amblyomma maculatum TaxID=34609 RepID=G3MLN7_AMBMU